MQQLTCRALCVAALLICASCAKEEFADPLPDLADELHFTNGSSLRFFSVMTDGEWSIESPQWLVCDPAAGTGNAEVSMTVEPNPGRERTGDLILTADGRNTVIKVVQSAVGLFVDTDEIVFDETGKSVVITIESAEPWSIDFGKAWWLSASPEEGEAGTSEVTLSPAAITDRTLRDKETISVTNDIMSVDIVVSQTVPNRPPSMPVLISPADEETDIPVNTSFVWKESDDPDGDTVSYELQVSEDGGQTWTYTAVTSFTSAGIDGLLSKGHECVWRVKATDIFGGEAVSETAVFRTGSHGGLLDGEVYEWQHESAGAPSPVHLVFTGDGFTAKDWADDGAYMKIAAEAIESIFEVEPYKSYRDYFRISIVGAHSNESGATVQQDMGYLGPGVQYRDTKFSSTLAGGGNTYVGGDDEMVWEYACKVPGITGDDDLDNTTVFILVNVDAYAGTCHAYSRGRSACFCPLGTMLMNGEPVYKAIILHEGAGHGFGCLLDEYRYYEEPIDTYSRQLIETFRRDNDLHGWNIDLTGDREKVHWNHYFGRSGYESVGLYEGAALYCYGVWRPEEISCMEDNRPYFNAPSREAIVRRICRIAGIPFDLEDFISRDAVRSDPTGISLQTKAPQMSFPRLAPPVLTVEE